MSFPEDMLSAAIAWATVSHAGQKDKAGQLYILHVLRVMLAVQKYGQIAMLVGVLHDVVEDCEVHVSTIEERFGKEVADGVDSVTRRKGESYEQFILRARQHPIGRYVKIADVRDNLRAEPVVLDVEGFAEQQARRLRYELALKKLEAFE